MKEQGTKKRAQIELKKKEKIAFKTKHLKQKSKKDYKTPLISRQNRGNKSISAFHSSKENCAVRDLKKQHRKR